MEFIHTLILSGIDCLTAVRRVSIGFGVREVGGNVLGARTAGIRPVELTEFSHGSILRIVSQLGGGLPGVVAVGRGFESLPEYQPHVLVTLVVNGKTPTPEGVGV